VHKRFTRAVLKSTEKFLSYFFSLLQLQSQQQPAFLMEAFYGTAFSYILSIFLSNHTGYLPMRPSLLCCKMIINLRIASTASMPLTWLNATCFEIRLGRLLWQQRAVRFFGILCGFSIFLCHSELFAFSSLMLRVDCFKHYSTTFFNCSFKLSVVFIFQMGRP